MGYNKAIKTEAGNELLSRVMAGETTIKFTKIATSEKSIEEFEIKQEMSANARKFTKESKVGVILDTVFSNATLTNGYNINVIGIYAKDKDNTEILFSYLTAKESPIYLEAYNGEVPQNIHIQVETGLWLSSESMIVIDQSGIATMQWVLDNMPPQNEFIITLPTDTTEYETITDSESKSYYKFTKEETNAKNKFSCVDIYFGEETILTNIENAQDGYSEIIKVVCLDGKIEVYIKKIPTNQFSIKVAQ